MGEKSRDCICNLTLWEKEELLIHLRKADMLI
jgi:hypothetical protein